MSKRNGILKDIRSNMDKYMMVAPYFLIFCVFTIIPIISSLFLSFTDFNLLESPNWVGWENYIRMIFQDDAFMTCVKNTLVFALITGPVSYFACLLVAWFVNELSPKLRTGLTVLFYAPSISSNIFIIWMYLFSGDMYGIVNGVFMSAGIINEPVQWLTDPKYTLTVIIIIQLWLSLGTGFLAFIAGLQGIDRSLYEAAAIDGIRNRYQELLYITLPSMGPQLLFGAVMQISSSFAVGQVSVELAGLPSTDYSADTVITHLIDVGTLRYEMGYASSIATVLFAAMIVANFIVRHVLKKFI